MGDVGAARGKEAGSHRSCNSITLSGLWSGGSDRVYCFESPNVLKGVLNDGVGADTDADADSSPEERDESESGAS